MILKHRMKFYTHSENALKQVLEQAPGKPFLNEEKKPIGEIVKATRIGDSDVIEFEINMTGEVE